MRLPESVTKIQPVGAVLKASEAGEALLREAGERVNARLLVGQADAAGLSRWEREYGLADRSFYRSWLAVQYYREHVAAYS